MARRAPVSAGELSWPLRVGCWLTVAAVDALAWSLWMLGHRSTLALGRRVGRLLYRLDAGRRRSTLHNLRLVLGTTLSDAEREAIARRVFESLASNFAELLWLRRADRARVAQLVEIDERSIQALEEARARGRGVILVGIHFGRWELMFLGFNLTGRSFTVLTRPLLNPYLDAYLNGIRCRFGNSAAHAGGPARSLYELLGAGEILLISMDHRERQPRQRVFTPFLGRPAALATGIARLARREGAALLPIYCLPLDGRRCRVVIGPEIEYERTGDRREQIESMTARCADAAGAIILSRPELWMWAHKRLWPRRMAPPDESPARSSAAPDRGSRELR